jgi:threonine aldolase
MISFESDYNNGAHPKVLQHIIDTNNTNSKSYGYDDWSENAKKKIKQACNCPEADIYFLPGGTQTNATVIDAILASYEGVIAAETAHINVHESGAIEAYGHKILTLPSHDGKILAEELESFLKVFHADPTCEHMVYPGMVYITFPSELGTLYTKKEIGDIYTICQNYNIPLYIDGARLGYGLMANGCDITLEWLCRHCDVFYIGGTKVGALCGEAVVFTHKNTPRHFFTIIKRHGALLAKSRLASVQFEALFTDNLYLNISKHAIEMAMLLRDIFINAGFIVSDSPTNQQFVVLKNTQIEKLQDLIAFETWEQINQENTLCRFVTSWATTHEDLHALSNAINTITE